MRVFRLLQAKGFPGCSRLLALLCPLLLFPHFFCFSLCCCLFDWWFYSSFFVWAEWATTLGHKGHCFLKNSIWFYLKKNNFTTCILAFWTLKLLIRGYFSENESIFFHSAKPHIFVKWVNPGLGCLFPALYSVRGGWPLTELIPMDLLNNLCPCSLCMFGTFPEWNLSCSSQLSSEEEAWQADCFLLWLCKPLVGKEQ